MYIEPAAPFDRFACSRLLRATGLTPTQIRARMAVCRRGWITPSTSSISAWMRTEGHVHAPTRPTDEVRGWLADALNIPRADLYRACAGEGPGWPDILPDHTIVRAGTIGCNTYGRDVMLIMARTDGHTLSDNYLTWEQTEKLAAQLADVIGRREVAGA